MTSRRVACFAVCVSLAACRPPPGPGETDGPTSHDAARHDAAQRDARVTQDAPEDHSAVHDSSPRERPDLSPPDHVADVGCMAMAGPSTLYEEYCNTSPSGICFIDHPPADF
jgi:hypothetical protein